MASDLIKAEGSHMHIMLRWVIAFTLFFILFLFFVVFGICLYAVDRDKCNGFDKHGTAMIMSDSTYCCNVCGKPMKPPIRGYFAPW